MPINYKDYPNNWKWLSKQIRKRSAEDDGIEKCELCLAENGELHPYTNSKVVLTVHHINFDITDSHELNLIALCQRCHLRLDIREKLRKRKIRFRTKEAGV